MEEILLGLLVQVITKSSEKRKVSQTYVSIGLVILLWAGYYIATRYYSIQWEKLIEWIWGVYASSQIFYNLFRKLWLLNK